MTRKHFKAIADAVANSHLCRRCKKEMAEDLAAALRQFNSRFDYYRFIDACLRESEVGK